MIENHHGVLYEMQPVVCERHHGIVGLEGRAVMEFGMVSAERGLICASCYREVRYATPEEAAEFHRLIAERKKVS